MADAALAAASIEPAARSVYHRGIYYLDCLARLHEVLRPRSYLEIGVSHGRSLALAQCPTLAIDPRFRLAENPIGTRRESYFFQTTSDDFFATTDLRRMLPGGVDLAFLDGLHHFEVLLRDLRNVEQFAGPDAVIAVHDCCPVNAEMTEREWRRDERKNEVTRLWWTGDVWKVLPILRMYRRDLRMAVLDSQPTGLLLLTGLDPASRVLTVAYDEIVARFSALTLEDYGIDRFRSEFPAMDSHRVYDDTALAELLGRA